MDDIFIPYTHLDTLFLALSILTYLADITLDVILAVTFLSNGEIGYSIISVSLVLFPALLVQIFSIRWHLIDESMNKPLWIIHACSLGVIHRYLEVISLGYEARKTGLPIDYQRFYQQQSDVCMLRLFDSFLESAPQLVFHLYLWLLKQHWPTQLVIWTGVSAIASMVSLGWGIASYTSALRMTRTEKNKMTMIGMMFQTIWRSGMLIARVVSLVLLTLYLDKWIIIVMFIHWFLMTLWVVSQNTDFCTTMWEERLYNAIVGVIYCFCFFNLKEGKSRYRALIFYTIIIVENFVFISLFYVFGGFRNPETHDYLALGGFVLVSLGTLLGVSGMLLYYRYFHPAGPINPCSSKASDIEPEKSASYMEKSLNKSSGPDFEIQDYVEHQNLPEYPQNGPCRPPRRKRVQYSRSFKDSCPPYNRFTPRKALNNSQSISPESVKSRINLAGTGDSAYGTDSNRTVSRSTASPKEEQDPSMADTSNRSGSSQAYNNETYMSVEKAECELMNKSQSISMKSGSLTDARSEVSQVSADSRVTVIDKKSRTPDKDQPEKLLKRSPVLKDVTSTLGSDVNKEEKQSTGKKGDALNAPLTIIIPNISHQAFARSKGVKTEVDKTIQQLQELNPRTEMLEKFSAHDYENLALVNINRGTLGVTHWRTYSDMAGNKHDDSTAYDRNKRNDVQKQKHSSSDYSNYGSLQYYDIYPLSREMKEQLYRSLTPVSTAATVASDTITNVTDSDTYEPIEVYNTQPGEMSNASSNNANPSLPLTLIHHDGQNVMTKEIVSLSNLKEALQRHEVFPMDDPEERGDLYLLAPMRLLTPILEENEPLDSTKQTDTTYQNAESVSGLNQSRTILHVISDILNSSSNNGYSNIPQPDVALQSQEPHRKPLFPDGRFADSTDTTSSLVHTIDEIRNSSLCNLFLSSFSDTNCPPDNNVTEIEVIPGNNAAPQVPPRNDYQGLRGKKALPKGDLNVSVNSIKSNTLVPSPSLSQKKTRLENEVAKSVEESAPVLPKKCQATPLSSSSAGTRKNILELGGDGGNILNTPKRPSKKELTIIPSQHEVGLPNPRVTPDAQKQQQQPSCCRNKNLRNVIGMNSTPNCSFNSSHNSLHPVCENSMPLSPSSKYETPTPPLRPNQFVRNSALNRPRRKFSVIRDKFEPGVPKPFMAGNFDLYQNISNNILCHDESHMSKSTPSFIDSRDFGLHPDDKYENLQRGWATSSIRESHRTLLQGQRNLPQRKSMSYIECETFPSTLSPIANKENENPPKLGPKPLRTYHQASSLSPKSNIFNIRK